MLAMNQPHFNIDENRVNSLSDKIQKINLENFDKFQQNLEDFDTFQLDDFALKTN